MTTIMKLQKWDWFFKYNLNIIVVIYLYCGLFFIHRSQFIAFLFHAVIKYDVLANSNYKNDSERYLTNFKHDWFIFFSLVGLFSWALDVKSVQNLKLNCIYLETSILVEMFFRTICRFVFCGWLVWTVKGKWNFLFNKHLCSTRPHGGQLRNCGSVPCCMVKRFFLSSECADQP